MADEEQQTVTAEDIGSLTEVITPPAEEAAKPPAEPLIGPNQVIESSRRLDSNLSASISRLSRGSLSAKITELNDRMNKFNRDSHESVDRVFDKVEEADRKRIEAEEAQHRHYDGLIEDFQGTIDAAERFSNLPLGGGSKR